MRRPISLSVATWLPPSACVSKPTISTSRSSGRSWQKAVSSLKSSAWARARAAGDEGDAHGEVLGHDGVGAAKALLQHVTVELLEGKVHAPLVGRELIAGDANVEVVEHHAGEDVRGRVVAHQQVSAGPFQLALHGIVHGESGALEPVEHAALVLHGLDDT